MFENETIICILCKAHINYTKTDSSQFVRHMNSQHDAFYGLDYLLSGSVQHMSEPKVLQEDAKLFNKKEMSNEIEVTKSEVTSRFMCSYCPLSFLFSDNMNAHIERKHLNKEDIADPLKQDPTIEIEIQTTNDSRNLPKEKQDRYDLQKISNLNYRLERKSGIVVQKNKQIKISPKIKKVLKNDQKVKELMETIKTQSGIKCPNCGKSYASKETLKIHFEDLHQPGEFPCQGCHKVFTSKNKMSSHYSRQCNPNRKTKRMTL